MPLQLLRKFADEVWESFGGVLQSFRPFVICCSKTNMEMNRREYLRIKDAAAFLGISEGTLRNWSQQGKVKVHRHPINGYRLYKTADLQSLLLAVRRSAERRENGK